MFRALLCPSSREQDCVQPNMVFCTGYAECGCVELGCELCALCESYCFFTLLFSVFCLNFLVQAIVCDTVNVVCLNFLVQAISMILFNVFCFNYLVQATSVILLMCSALISLFRQILWYCLACSALIFLFRPVSVLLFSVFCFNSPFQASSCDTV